METLLSALGALYWPGFMAYIELPDHKRGLKKACKISGDGVGKALVSDDMEIAWRDAVHSVVIRIIEPPGRAADKFGKISFHGQVL